MQFLIKGIIYSKKKKRNGGSPYLQEKKQITSIEMKMMT